MICKNVYEVNHNIVLSSYKNMGFDRVLFIKNEIQGTNSKADSSLSRFAEPPWTTACSPTKVT